MRSEEFIKEIERIPATYFRGGKQRLSGSGPARGKSKLKPLPGGSRFQYYVTVDHGWPTVMLFDPEMTVPEGENKANYYVRNPIGTLTLKPDSYFPLTPAYTVDWITVDEDYRGQGIAKSLYGIVLAIMGATLVAGESQTPGGRRNWVSIYSVPGAVVRAYVMYHPNYMTEKIQKILKQAGATVLGQNRYGHVTYSLPVRMRPGGRELALLTARLKLYSNWQEDDSIGLYAQFKGQQSES
jgi:GNAT superfamily N-acetyltransferase